MNRIDYEMPAEEYHSDPCEKPSLSASIAHRLVSESPMHAHAAHPRLGGLRFESTDAMDLGTIGHSILLGTPDPRIIVIKDENGDPYTDWKTKRAQAQRNMVEGLGKIAVLDKQLEAARVMADAWRKQLEQRGIELAGHAEASMFWEEVASDGTVVQCRGRLDLLHAALITDLKTCRSAKPKSARSSIEEHGAHVQSAAYRSGLGKVFPEFQGRTRYRWIFAETKAPYVLQDYEPAGSMRRVGELMWRQAIDLWAMCTQTGEWPAFSRDTIRLEASPWTQQQAESFEMEEESHGNAA